MRSVSAEFHHRWLATPVIAKQAFHQELSDIIAMLKSDVPADEFNFTHQDFGKTMADLLKTHKAESKQTPKTTPPVLTSQDDTTPSHDAPTTPPPPSLSSNEVAILEERIFERLASKLDDTLSNYMADLSEELREWLKDNIKKELANYTKTP